LVLRLIGLLLVFFLVFLLILRLLGLLLLLLFFFLVLPLLRLLLLGDVRHDRRDAGGVVGFMARHQRLAVRREDDAVRNHRLLLPLLELAVEDRLARLRLPDTQAAAVASARRQLAVARQRQREDVVGRRRQLLQLLALLGVPVAHLLVEAAR